MTITIFIDTEFTDFDNPQLISIGLSVDENTFFYEEFYYQLEECSEFTVSKVLPLLYNKAKPFEVVKNNLNEWLRAFSNEVIIVGDHWGDWLLFKKLLEKDHSVIGFVNIEDFLLKEAKIRVPSLHPVILKKEFENLLDIFFRFQKKWYNDNYKAAHHALNDVLANQYAFQHVLNYTTAP